MGVFVSLCLLCVRVCVFVSIFFLLSIFLFSSPLFLSFSFFSLLFLSFFLFPPLSSISQTVRRCCLNFSLFCFDMIGRKDGMVCCVCAWMFVCLWVFV